MPLFRLDALPLGPDALDRLETFLLLALSSVIRGRLVMEAILDRYCVALQSGEKQLHHAGRVSFCKCAPCSGF